MKTGEGLLHACISSYIVNIKYNFADTPFLALTGTADKSSAIISLLSLHDPVKLLISPERMNLDEFANLSDKVQKDHNIWKTGLAD